MNPQNETNIREASMQWHFDNVRDAHNPYHFCNSPVAKMIKDKLQRRWYYILSITGIDAAIKHGHLKVNFLFHDNGQYKSVAIPYPAGEVKDINEWAIFLYQNFSDVIAISSEMEVAGVSFDDMPRISLIDFNELIDQYEREHEIDLIAADNRWIKEMKKRVGNE